jgi:hypothetical protein
VKKSLLLATLYIHSLCSYGQIVRAPIGTVYTSLRTYSSQFKDAFSFRANAASLAGIKEFSAGIYSERRFMLQELSSYSFAAALPTTTGCFGMRGDYTGGSLYNETAVGLSFAKRLGNKVDVGTQFHYFSAAASSYGTASAITFDAGAIFHLTEQIQTGVHVYNPVRMKLVREEKIPSVYAAGIGYDASPQLFIGAEAQKTEDQPLSINAGLQYVFGDKLIACGGISSATSVYYIGFGVKLKSLRVDVTASFHSYFGITPGLLLVYSPPK